MDLATIRFQVDTVELDRASKVIGGLATDLSNLNRVSKEVAQTEATLAKAAKANADANLQNAKAQDVRLKSTIAADKADQSTEKAVKKSTEATERHTRAVKANADILAYQTDRAKFMAEGFSSGNASTLAQAKAVGQLSDELKKILDLQRSFQGNISFDKSDMGIKRLTKSYNEATESQKLFAEGTSLTIEQARELSRDQNRIAASMKFMGKSMDEITAAQRVYANEYNNVASAYNRIDAAEKAVIKQRKEVVSATNYVTQADQRMAAALNVSNVGLDRASSDSLVKYETALRKSGVAQDVLTTKLATYKTQLSQVQAQEQKRAEQHLARALSPQLTDIGVSLYSGQAPLTVLLQQSGQIVDLFRLSGVEAQNFGKAMRESFYSMIPAISTVAKGMTSLAVGMVADAGSALTGFVGKITGITAATEIMKRAIASGGEENFKYIASIQKLGNAFSVVAGVGIAALIAGLVAVGLEYKKILQSEAELSVALATSGGALGFSKDQAVQYAQSLQGVGIGTLKAQEAIAEFAKAGKIGQDGLTGLMKAAVDFEKTTGTALSETAKQYAKLQDAPGKTLTEIAEKMGNVDSNTLDTVRSLELQGEKARAAFMATEAYANAMNIASSEVRSNWSPLEVLWNDIKSVLGKVKQEIYDITTSNRAVGAFRTVWETVAVVVSQVWFTLKGVGTEIGGIAAQIGAVMRGDFAGAKSIGEQMKIDAQAAREEQDKLITSLLTRGQVEGKQFNESKKQQSDYAAWLNENDKAIVKSISKKEQYAIKEKQLQKDLESGLIKEVQYNEALAGWKKIIFGEEKKKKDTKTESFFDSSMKALRNNTIEAAVANDGLVESQVKLLQIIKDPAFAKMTEIQKIQIMQAGAAAIATEQQAEAVKQLEKAEEFRLKVLGKSEGVGKQYYSDMEALMKYAKTAGWTTEQVEEMTRALYMQTPAWKEHEKALESSRQVLNKFNEESIAYQSGTAKTNEELDYRISLLGKTATEQKILSTEYQREQKLRENAVVLGKKLRDIEEGITKAKKAKKTGLSESELKKYEDAKIQAIQDSAERERAINRETAVVYAEDLQKEIDAIKSAISGSIVTALFDGGKEGSKKLRQVLVDTLRKKVTIVVDAVVNTLVGNVVGSLFGGAGAASGGGAGGLLNLGMQGASLYSGLTSGSGILGTIGGWLGLGGASSAYALGAGGLSLGAGAASGIGLSAGGGGLGVSMGGQVLGSGAAGAASAGGISGALSSIPGWGWAIAGIAALASIFTKKATPHIGAASSYAASTGLVSGKDIYGASGLADTRTYNAEVEKVTGSIAQTLGQTLDATAKSFGKSAGFEISTAFADDTSKDGAWGSLVIKQMGKEVLNWADTQVSKWAPKEFADGEEGMKQYLAAVAVSMKDALLKMDLPGWANNMLKAVGDAPSVENLSQVISQINAASTALDAMRKNLVGFAEYTDISISKLVEFTGGIEGLVSVASTYYENFYSEGEKAANSTRDIAEALAKVGLEMPTTREGFRALVEQQMKLGDSGVAAVATLLGVNSAFFGVTERLTGLTNETKQLEIELLRASGKVAEADALLRKLATEGFNAAELAAYDYNEALKKQVQTYKDGVNSATATDDAYKALERAVDAQRKILNETITNLRAVFDVAKKAAKSLYGEVDSVRKQSAVAGNAFINQALQDLKNSGVIPDGVKLQDAIDDAIQGLSSEVYDSAFEEQRGRLILAGKLTQIADLTEPQLTVAEKQLKDLDAILETARKQIDELRGINTSVLSVATAVSNLAAAMVAEKKGVAVMDRGGGSSGLGSAAAAAGQAAALGGDLYKAVVNHGKVNGDDAYYLIPGFNDFASKQATNEKIASLTGMSVAEVWGLQEGGSEAYWQAVQGAYDSGAIVRSGDSLEEVLAKLPKLSVGTNYVERSGAAYIHEGEAVVPKAFNPFNPNAVSPLTLNSPGSSSVSTVSTQDNSDIIEENRLLRQELQAQNGAMVRLLSKVARVVERWDGNGMPETRVV